MLIRDGPLNPGTLGLYWRLGSDGVGVRSYGIKSKTRVSNSNTGLDRMGTNVLMILLLLLVTAALLVWLDVDASVVGELVAVELIAFDEPG